ncbi:siderophore-interacting protein [Sphingobium sp. HWE2-09]|uniref:siderophore-interacting protein n=1 Tax=Sphingobium sp. HWE2-09 TaxID=3108390 RepID=UPI002DD1672D|nr:siderophore-interacting protein [Sphingobium sp. HWE2-09]
MLERPVYREFTARVVAVEDLTPRMRRVTFQVENFSDLGSVSPGQWMKLFFDDAKQGRAYTIRNFRSAVQEIDLDFVLHHEAARPGPAARWVRSVAIGSTVRLYGPRSDFRHIVGRRLCLFGDECALPAISGILEQLPAGTRAVAIIEVNERCAVQTLETHGHLMSSWILGGHGPYSAGLATFVQNLILDPASDQIWIGCESSMARKLRIHLGNHGFDKHNMHISGYWKIGAADYVDSHSDY